MPLKYMRRYLYVQYKAKKSLHGRGNLSTLPSKNNKKVHFAWPKLALEKFPLSQIYSAMTSCLPVNLKE